MVQVNPPRADSGFSIFPFSLIEIADSFLLQPSDSGRFAGRPVGFRHARVRRKVADGIHAQTEALFVAAGA